MKIKWHGHACFEIESEKGMKVIIDPYDGSIGYDIPHMTSDIVTISHNHFDHNNVSAVSGNYTIIDKSGEYTLKDVKISGFETYHDEVKGAKRGPNIVFKFSIDGIDICHLGDLGHEIDGEQLKSIGNIDVLLIPVGGVYTIDANIAKKIVDSINPKIVIPMHYKTQNLRIELDKVDKFAQKFEKVSRINSNELVLNNNVNEYKKSLIILNYK